jgi:hypothetical protein
MSNRPEIDGRVIYRSPAGPTPCIKTRSVGMSWIAPPNEIWPIRNEFRPGCYVLVSACWRRAEAPRIGPREAFDPLWDELMHWLAGCPPLTDIETFWMHDADHGWDLCVTGIDALVAKDLTPLEAAVIKHWDVFAHFDYRRTQRANRKRRTARKRKRGWA